MILARRSSFLGRLVFFANGVLVFSIAFTPTVGWGMRREGVSLSAGTHTQIAHPMHHQILRDAEFATRGVMVAKASPRPEVIHFSHAASEAALNSYRSMPAEQAIAYRTAMDAYQKIQGPKKNGPFRSAAEVYLTAAEKLVTVPPFSTGSPSFRDSHASVVRGSPVLLATSTSKKSSFPRPTGSSSSASSHHFQNVMWAHDEYRRISQLHGQDIPEAVHLVSPSGKHVVLLGEVHTGIGSSPSYAAGKVAQAMGKHADGKNVVVLAETPGNYDGIISRATTLAQVRMGNAFFRDIQPGIISQLGDHVAAHAIEALEKGPPTHNIVKLNSALHQSEGLISSGEGVTLALKRAETDRNHAQVRSIEESTADITYAVLGAAHVARDPAFNSPTTLELLLQRGYSALSGWRTTPLRTYSLGFSPTGPGSPNRFFSSGSSLAGYGSWGFPLSLISI